MSKPFTPPQQRFWNKVIKTKSCWIWNGAKHLGYGQFHNPGGSRKAHRFSYETYKGKIPDGLVLDHLCRNPSCVNPDHLEAVPQKTNMNRSECFIGCKSRQTHCIHGHEYTIENTLRHHGRRKCRACKLTPESREAGRLRTAKYRAKKKMEKINQRAPSLIT